MTKDIDTFVSTSDAVAVNYKNDIILTIAFNFKLVDIDTTKFKISQRKKRAYFISTDSYYKKL